MTRIKKKRWLSALKHFAKVNRLIKKGYIVFDKYSRIVKDPFKYDKDEQYIYQGNNYRAILLSKKQNWDHYLDLSLPSFKKEFSFTAIHPKHIRKV